LADFAKGKICVCLSCHFFFQVLGKLVIHFILLTACLTAGQNLYAQICSPCHGETGEGGEVGGAALTAELGLGDLLSVVLYGRKNMPASENV